MITFKINIKPCEKQGIYAIANSVDERVYIGRTRNFKRRAYQHKESFLNGECNKKIKDFIRENPDVSFEFYVVLETDELKEREEEYIARYNAVESGFNVIHCDEEIKDIFDYNRKVKFKHKTHKPHKISNFEYLGLQKGYLRKDGVLIYNPSKARSILKNCIIVEEEKKTKKIKTKKKKKKTKKTKKSKRYDWASVGISLLKR